MSHDIELRTTVAELAVVLPDRASEFRDHDSAPLSVAVAGERNADPRHLAAEWLHVTVRNGDQICSWSPLRTT